MKENILEQLEKQALEGFDKELYQERHKYEALSACSRIGILTSGGDAPGMNALIRGITRTALYYDLRVFGIQRGFHGLSHGHIEELKARDVSDTLQRGGTFLMSARSETFMTEKGMNKTLAIIEAFNLDCVFCIGGEGTWKGAYSLAKQGVPVMVLPATIDNDIGASDYSIGFDTAVNTAVSAVDKLRDTVSSHERCSVVEVMGRDSGHIAMAVGLAGGAEIVIVPEHPLDLMNDVIGNILSARNRGKRHYIVVLAEGCGKAQELAKTIEEYTGIESRGTNLGYVQRGGSPSARDRTLASLMGVHSVRALLEGRLNRAIVLKEGVVQDIPLEEAIHIEKVISDDLSKQADILTF